MSSTANHGQAPRMSRDAFTDVKDRLNPKKREALKKAVQKRYPHDIKAPQGLSRAVANKLSLFQVLYTIWKNGIKSKAGEVKGLNDLDEKGTNFDTYRDDPSLFDDLM